MFAAQRCRIRNSAMFTNLIILFSCLLITLRSQANKETLSECEGCAEALTEILENVTLSFVDLPLPRKGDLGFTITTMSCYHVSFKKIDIDTSSSPSYDIEALLSLVCNGTLRHFSTSDAKFHGRLHFTVDVMSLDLNVGFGFRLDESSVPISMFSSKCSAKPKLSISIFGKIEWLNKLSNDFLHSFLECFVNFKICDPKNGVIPTILNGKGSQAITAVHNVIFPYLDYDSFPKNMNGFWFEEDAVQYEKYENLLRVPQELLMSKNDENHTLIESFLKYAFGIEDSVTIKDMGIPFSSGDLALLSINGTLENVTLFGLQSLGISKLLSPWNQTNSRSGFNGLYSLESKVNMGIIGFSLNGTAVILPGSLESQGKEIFTDFSVSGKLKNVDLDVLLSSPLILRCFEAIRFGDIISSPLQCTRSCLHDLSIDLLDLEIEQIYPIRVKGFSKLAPLLNQIIDVVFLTYDGSMSKLIRGLVADIGRNVIDDFIRENVLSLDPVCPKSDDVFPGLFRMNESHFFKDIAFIANAFDPVLGMGYTVNDAVHAIFGESSIIGFNGSLFDVKAPINLFGIEQAHFKVSDFSIRGLDSFTRMIPLFVNSSFELSSHVTLGTSSLPLSLGARIGFSISGKAVNDGHGMYDDVFIQLSLEDAGAYSSLTMEVIENSFMNLSLNALKEISYLCPFTSFAALALDDMILSTRVSSFNLSCIQCSSPLLLEIEEQLTSPDADVVIQKILSESLQFLSAENTINHFNLFLKQALLQAQVSCANQQYPHFSISSEGDPNLHRFWGLPLIFWIVIGVVLMFICIAIVLEVIRVSSVKKIQLSADLEWYDADAALLDPREDDILADSTSCVDIDDITSQATSLALEKDIPLWLTVMLTIACLASFVILTTATVSHLQFINANVYFAGDKFSIHNIEKTTPLGVFLDMYNAGIYSIALMLLFFSGNWPSLRVILLLIAWYIPKWIVPEEIRGSALYWLNVLGKLTWINLFVLFMVNLALSRDIDSSFVLSKNADAIYNISIFVHTGWAMTGFIIGIFIQNIVNHVMLELHYCHSSISKTLVYKPKLSVRKQWTPLFLSKKYCVHSDKMISLTFLSRMLICIGLVSSISLTIFSIWLKSFYFDFQGLVGALLVGHSYIEYSFYDLGTRANTGSDDLSAHFTTFTFILIVVIAPILHAVSLLVLFFMPMTHYYRIVMRSLSEHLRAWDCLEICLLTVVFTVYQFRQFLLFKVRNICHDVNNVLDALAPDAFAADPRCIDFDSEMLATAFVALASVLLSNVMHEMLMMWSSDKLRDFMSGYHQCMTKLGLFKSLE